MTEDDKGFFQQHPELSEGTEPDHSLEFAETVDKLDREQLGRAIAISDSGPQGSRVTHGMSGEVEVHQLPDNATETVIGYALPLEPDDTKHLIVFKDGQMVVTEPWSNAHLPVSDQMKEKYQHNFGANPTPYAESRRSWKSVPGAVHSLKKYGINYAARVTDANTASDKTEFFDQMFDRSIDIASQRKQEREQVRRQTMKSFMSKLDQTIFKGPDEASPSAPPIT